VNLPETKYVTVGDGQVAYQVLGDGPVDLVFNHGHCHIDVHWELAPEASFFSKLASFSRLILFDRRGSGASDRVENGAFPTWEEWNRDLLAVLDAVGSERTAIFAEYEAGPLAIFFAATNPSRVSSLVLGNTAARYGAAADYEIGYSKEYIGAFLDFYEAAWGTPEMGQVFSSIAGDRLACEALAKVLRASATPMTATAQARYVLEELDAREWLPLVQAPSLVMVNRGRGDETGTARVAMARHTASLLRLARYVEFDAPDSMFFVGDNDEAIDEVAEFLTGARRATVPDRVLATLLFTDIVASTKHLASDGDRHWAATLDAHDAAVRHELARFQGREVNTTGDGFLAAFDGPARAVRCAKAIVDRVAGLGLETRAGLHAGECEVRGGDLAGMAVHVAARVAQLAGPSDIWVSSTVKELVVGSGLEFDTLGRFELKGVPDEWLLYRVI